MGVIGTSINVELPYVYPQGVENECDSNNTTAVLNLLMATPAEIKLFGKWYVLFFERIYFVIMKKQF